MDTSSSSPETGRSSRRIGPIVVGSIVFGSLMALRYELPSVWARAAVAGCAFVVLGWAIVVSRRARA